MLFALKKTCKKRDVQKHTLKYAHIGNARVIVLLLKLNQCFN